MEIKELVHSSPSLSCLNYLKGQIAYRVGLHGHRSGATHVNFSIEQSLSYIQDVVGDYLRYGGTSICGKRVLEVGPGDNLGVALLLYALGAESVTCIDRFSPVQNARHNDVVYEALISKMPPQHRARARQALHVKGDGRTEFDPHCIRHLYELPIEESVKVFGAGSFDLILSRAVLEHVGSVKRAWESMVMLLRPGGEMWHRIDLRNHEFFDVIHPLHFLTIPASLWRVVSSPDPTLNRARRCCFSRLSEIDFGQTECWITRIVRSDELRPHKRSVALGVDYDTETLESVRAIRPKLASPYKDLSDEELLVSGIFLVSRNKL